MYLRREPLDLHTVRRILATGTAGSRLQLTQRKVERAVEADLVAELHLGAQEGSRCSRQSCLAVIQTFWAEGLGKMKSEPRY